MIVIKPRAIAILYSVNYRYASQTYKRFYGKSPYRNWQVQINRIINSLEHSSDKYGLNLKINTDWGEIIYSKLGNKHDSVVVIENFHFNYTDLHRWFTHAVYPPTTRKTSSTPKINSISYVKPVRSTTLPNGTKIYAIQSDSHLYSLADKGKRQVINYWFSSLSFPLSTQIGNLNIIGWGSINNIPYYIDDNLQLHHAAKVATLQKNKRFESINRQSTLILTEAQFKRLLNECITKIINEIVL